jgi:hypothetical protein
MALFGGSPLGTGGLLYVGSVKYKAQTANKPNLKPGILTALKWWQVEK